MSLKFNTCTFGYQVSH